MRSLLRLELSAAEPTGIVLAASWGAQMAARRTESVEERLEAAVTAVKAVPPRRMKDFLTTLVAAAPEFGRTRRIITLLNAVLGVLLLALGGTAMVLIDVEFKRALAPMLFGSFFLGVGASLASGQPLTLREITTGLQRVLTNQDRSNESER
jgi:hypothetical protein